MNAAEIFNLWTHFFFYIKITEVNFTNIFLIFFPVCLQKIFTSWTFLITLQFAKEVYLQIYEFIKLCPVFLLDRKRFWNILLELFSSIYSYILHMHRRRQKIFQGGHLWKKKHLTYTRAQTNNCNCINKFMVQ